MKRDDFDWNEDSDTVVASQTAVAVYPNARGDIVIRQKAGPVDREDAVVIIRRENAAKLLQRLEVLCSDEACE